MHTELLTYEDFIEDFQPVDNPHAGHGLFGGCLFLPEGEELAAIKSADIDCVWTLLESDSMPFILPGRLEDHRFGHFLTKAPHSHADIQVVLSEHWHEAANYAFHLPHATAIDRLAIAETCEEQGIIAAAVCFYLMKQGHEAVARRLITTMIGHVLTEAYHH